MSSLKSMMAAKKAQHRITAPHAKYSNSGQLSCSLCGLAIKHESLWGAHVQSKAHRVNVQKLEAEQRQAAAEAERSSAKRRREDGPGDDEEGAGGDASKRARDGDEVGRLPSGFFADPSQAPPPAPSTSSSAAGASTHESTSAAMQGRDAAQEEEEDPEWAEFEKYLASGSNAGPAQDSGASRSTASATIKAAPVKFEFGAPVVEEDGEGVGAGGDDEPEEEEEQETEEERIEREMREEREEMMARLEEEEREQREADEKVTALKKRLEAIRAARQKK
ncbi:hypothetical protein JCM8115_001342 [Rhodotorula mucilaginosa]|uniref:Retrotransposon-like protein 1 n=1 Tax=Rhodotorula mucilaginosa TaxID=5537 RepID=A0A9P6W9I3_RHOMI|nr:retrotransposon-like protein 1 [Rhodotorula mucilaginosa]TKA53834.1 hypothetical protein B0A53_03624 [Rhodotorula sp. CCFEE 5036]